MQRRRGASTGQKWMCRQCWHYICRSLSSQTSASAACLEPVTRIPSRSVWLHTLSAGSLCLPSTLRKRTEGELEGSTSARSKLFDILVLKCQLLNYQGAFFFFSRVLSVSPCNSVQTFYQQTPWGKNQLSKTDKAIWHGGSSYHF